MAKSATRVEIYAAKDGARYRAKARNGEVIATSEAYTRPSDAKRGAQRAFPSATIVMLCTAKLNGRR